MPVVLRERGYRFEFYASDADERRHVKKNGKHAKVWLEPVVELVYSRRCMPHEMNEIVRLVQQHQDQFVEDWNEFFGRGA